MERRQSYCLPLEGKNLCGQSSTGVEACQQCGGHQVFKNVNLKEQSKNNISLFQNENGHPTKRDTRQRSLILSLPSSLMLMMAKRVPVSWAVRMVNNLVWDLLFQLSPYKFMGLDGIHPRTLKELANVFVRSLSMIFFMILGMWC